MNSKAYGNGFSKEDRVDISCSPNTIERGSHGYLSSEVEIGDNAFGRGTHIEVEDISYTGDKLSISLVTLDGNEKTIDISLEVFLKKISPNWTQLNVDLGVNSNSSKESIFLETSNNDFKRFLERFRDKLGMIFGSK